MLKFEGITVGTIIKAYDFEPMEGRRDRYVTGEILDTVVRDGAKFYVVHCHKDSAFGPDHNRIGRAVLVPMEMCMDYDGRIVEMSMPLSVKEI